ncbi:MAG: hypothetical protein LAP85_15350 [Acidobacteriia bacterium]|nr:hypothetical protein [Terriglobia bacterium]
MELYEDRIINGVLKSDLVCDPEVARSLLSQDIEIVAAADRANSDDLWPCIWALASVLQRQFSGNVFMRCGRRSTLNCPAQLGTRCRFVEAPIRGATRIFIGAEPDPEDFTALWGDARGAHISYQSLVEGGEAADPIACFALAGYLGFAALATTVRIPPFRKDLAIRFLELPFSHGRPWNLPQDGLTLVGLGQLGQAYLSLLYFLAQNKGETPAIMLLDKGSFEHPNYSTQILLEDGDAWEGREKAKLLATKAQGWRWRVEGEVTELKWNWKRPANHPRLAVLGLDDFDVRRMAVAAGYEWLIEAGLGTSFLAPRLSWHSLSPEPMLARKLFVAGQGSDTTAPLKNTAFVRHLKETPGGCGWVTFQNVQASAPALGLVAAAYVWCEIIHVLSGNRVPIQGRACAWSPFLPFFRQAIN